MIQLSQKMPLPGKLRLADEIYGSQSSSRCKNYRMQMKKWAGDNPILDPYLSGIRQGKVLHYLQYLLEVDRTHIVATVELPQKTIFD